MSHKPRYVLLHLLTLLAVLFSGLGTALTPEPVAAQATPTCITSRISASSDDVEERTDNGAVDDDGDTSTHSLQTVRAYAGGSGHRTGVTELRFPPPALNAPATDHQRCWVTFRANAGSAVQTRDDHLGVNSQRTRLSRFTDSTNNVSNRHNQRFGLLGYSEWTSGSDFTTPSLAGELVRK